MTVKYVIHKNPIASNPDYCRAIVVGTVVHTIEDVIKEITKEGSILKETECVAVSNALLKQIGKNLTKGIGFQSKYFSISIVIQGTFKSLDDEFDEEIHRMYANLQPEEEWVESMAKAKLEKVKATENRPRPKTLLDYKSKERDCLLSPGNVAEIKGTQLKVNINADDEGIFLISENGSETIKADYLFQSYPQTLIFEIPDNLAKGKYIIEVRNRPHKVKSLRKGTLDSMLIVV